MLRMGYEAARPRARQAVPNPPLQSQQGGYGRNLTKSEAGARVDIEPDSGLPPQDEERKRKWMRRALRGYREALESGKTQRNWTEAMFEPKR